MKDILRTSFCGVALDSPFLLAASPCTDTAEMLARSFESGWAGAVLKTTSMPEQEVNIAYPIISGRTDGGKLLALHNIDLISEQHAPAVAQTIRALKAEYPEKVVIASIEGSTKADWELLAGMLGAAGADMIECGLSCPQGTVLQDEETVGWMISQDPSLTKKVVGWVKAAAPRTPVYPKLTSTVTDLVGIARAAAAGGADAICVIDSVEAIIGVDLQTLSPLPSVGGFSSHGGYTGRAIKPIALRCVADVAKEVDVPVSATGGIYDWRDAAEFLLLGASVLQVCTAAMEEGFGIVEDLKVGLTRWLEGKGCSSIREIVGCSLPYLKSHDQLPHDIVVRSQIDLDRCIGCGRCYVSCRDGGHQAIRFPEDRKPSVDDDKCVGCGLCVLVCPVAGCIEIRALDCE